MASDLDELISGLGEAATVMSMSDREMALYTARLAGAGQAEIDFINTQYDKIDAFNAVKEATDIVNRGFTSQQIEAEKLADDYTNGRISLELYTSALKRLNDEINAGKKKEKPDTNPEKLEGQVQGFADMGMDPLDKLKQERENRLAIIKEYDQLEIANKQLVTDAKEAIEADYEARKMAAMEQSYMAQSEANAMLINGLNSFGNTAANVFTGMLTQTMSASDAVRGLG